MRIWFATRIPINQFILFVVYTTTIRLFTELDYYCNFFFVISLLSSFSFYFYLLSLGEQIRKLEHIVERTKQ